MAEPESAPAAHLVAVRGAEGGGGVLVRHVLCDAPPVYVPNHPGQDDVRAIDIIQAVVGHQCPSGTKNAPADWVTP